MALKDDLVSYWKHDTNGSFPDAHGSDTGTINGATYTASGKLSGGYEYDGSNDSIDIGLAPSDLAGGDFTLGFWVKPTDADRTGNTVLYATDGSLSSWPRLIIWGSSTNYARFYSSSTQWVDTGAIVDNTWYHIVVTRVGNLFTMYFNGSSVDTNTHAVTFSDATNFAFGQWQGQAADRQFYGVMDEIFYSSRGMSSDEVAEIYNSGDGLGYDDWDVVPVSVDSPNGGEVWVVGRSEAITWTDGSGASAMKIEISTNNGVDYSVIVESTDNDGSYDYVVSADISAQCLIKITSVDDAGVTDVSDAVFSIIAAPSLGDGGGQVINSWLMLVDWITNRLFGVVEWSSVQLREWGFASPHKQVGSGFFSARVVGVHDGDTISLSTGWRDFNFPLRIANIDAPEMNEGGEKARDWLRSRILGQNVVVSVNPKNRVGKYGRLIGEVFHGGFNLGDEMRRRGLVFKFGQRNLFKVPDLGKLLQEAAL